MTGRSAAADGDDAPLPAWFWTLPLLALAAWWPLSPFWASDDFLALHYAQDLGRVLSDFTGPQYGATDIWLFYRPLITLSFWLDHRLGGGDPFVAHLSNALAHAASTLLVGLLWLRMLQPGGAFAAALLWSIMPGHAGSIAWAVGRVDSHTTVWILLTLWLFVRHCEGRTRRRWPMLLTFTAALMSKELALVVPLLASVLGGALAEGRGRAAFLVGARRSWPLWLALAVYLPFRVLVLGRFGGYLAASHDLGPMLAGFGQTVLDLLNPWRWTNGTSARATFGTSSPWLTGLGYLPLAAAPWFWLQRNRLPELTVAVVLFLIACLPIAAFFAGADNHHNLRYCYLPSIALTGLLAASGRWVTGLVLVLWLPPLVDMRSEQLQADRSSAKMHAALRREAADGAKAPMFVAGMPHQTGNVVQLHFGIDRMLRPPFHDADVSLYALRPLAEMPGVLRLPAPDQPPFALPAGSTWFFVGADGLVRSPAAELPELPLAGPVELDLTSPRLERMASRELTIAIDTPEVRPEWYRLTILTASGYLGSLAKDHADAGATAGRIDLLRYFEQAKYGPGDHYVLRALEVPTTIDLEPSFPVLLEAGVLADPADPTTFQPTHRARRLLTWRFDRDFPRFVRRVLGLE